VVISVTIFLFNSGINEVVPSWGDSKRLSWIHLAPWRDRWLLHGKVCARHQSMGLSSQWKH